MSVFDHRISKSCCAQLGFHAPQEAARVLGEAADLARQGQITAMKAGTPTSPAAKAEE